MLSSNSFRVIHSVTFSSNCIDLSLLAVTATDVCRCLFDLARFTAENGLALVGASWMRAENDLFVNMTYIQAGGNVTDLCAGTATFQEPCASHARACVPTFFVILLAICLKYIS